MIVYEPGARVLIVPMVREDVKVGVPLAGRKLQLMPDGMFGQARLTVSCRPPTTVRLVVVVPPGRTTPLFGERVNV